MIEVLDKAMAKDPADRYRHAGDFELDLRRARRALESRSVSAAAAPAPRPRRAGESSSGPRQSSA